MVAHQGLREWGQEAVVSPAIANLKGHFTSKNLAGYVKVFDALFEERTYDGKGLQSHAYGIDRKCAARWSLDFQRITKDEALACWYLNFWLPMMGQEIVSRSPTLAQALMLMGKVDGSYNPKVQLACLSRALNALQSPDCAHFPLPEDGVFNLDIIRCLDSYITWRKGNADKALVVACLCDFTARQLALTKRGGYCEDTMYEWLLGLKW